ncbi:cytochrome C [Methylovirgula ligni]|uniref:Cbb3-type cytochrome c oxidase subunit III n=1 Tax=Methylovirgula ligni TaxID=569860 RepID=A0A3D9Z3C9_9HYPH|nr:cytochrome C [Methylovirgula ligni]REF89684.1 cbb3-type cytochrome c oxidase subunit III [Methylovirgula ligni]
MRSGFVRFARTLLVVFFAANALESCLLSPALAQSAEPDLTSPKLIDAGRVQFAENCVYCHGDSGSGGKAGPLAGRTDLTADYVFQTITNGKRVGSLVMPTWGLSLDKPTIWSLTAYVMSLQAKK